MRDTINYPILRIQAFVDTHAPDDVIRNGENIGIFSEMIGSACMFVSGVLTKNYDRVLASSASIATYVVSLSVQERHQDLPIENISHWIGAYKRHIVGTGHLFEGYGYFKSAEGSRYKMEYTYSALAAAGGLAMIASKHQVDAWNRCGVIFTPFYFLNKGVAYEAYQAGDTSAVLSVLPYDTGSFCRHFLAGSPRRKAMLEKEKQETLGRDQT